MTFPSLHLLFCRADLLDVLICNVELFWQEQSYNRGANWWTSIFTVSPSRLDRRLKYKNKFQPQITQGWCWIALFVAKLLRSSLINIHCTVFELYLNQIIYSHIAYIWKALIANDRLINVELTSAGRYKAKSCLYLVLEQPVIHHQVSFLRSSTQYEAFEADVQ